MSRTVKIISSLVVAALGFVWMILDVIGTAATAIDLLDWVPIWTRKLAAHEELAYQLGPWFLMCLGVVSLLAIHLWPGRQLMGPQALPGDLEPLTVQRPVSEEQDLKRGFDRATFRRYPSRDAAVFRLAQLYGDGVVIRNEAVVGGVNDDNLQDWLGKVDTWMREVIDVLGYVDRVDSERFKTLDVVTPARIQAPINLRNQALISVFVSNYFQHDLRLVRLNTLLSKYQGVPDEPC